MIVVYSCIFGVYFHCQVSDRIALYYHRRAREKYQHDKVPFNHSNNISGSDNDINSDDDDGDGKAND
jgi:hypothetical protein